MKKQKRTPGSILKIDLDDGYYNYAQILDKTLVFFNIKTKEILEGKALEKMFDLPVLFYVTVYDDVITSGRWQKVGKLPIREEFKVLPMKFIQDSINPKNFELYDPNTGKISPSTYEECKDLECAAVWEAEHVVERLIDHFNGIPNKWVESLKAKTVN